MAFNQNSRALGSAEKPSVIAEVVKFHFTLDGRRIAVPFCGIHHECLKDNIVKLKRCIE